MEETKTSYKTGMPRLLELAATKKPLVIASVTFSSLAAIASFVPYIAIYYVIRELLHIWPNFSSLDSPALMGYAYLALGGMALNVLFYMAALMCSHMAAFGTLYQLKINFASHLAKLPLGFHGMIGSGKLRKITDENIEKIEQFIAHQLPDMVAAFVAPVVMIVLLLFVDWRFGCAAIIGIVAAFVLQMLFYGRDNAKEMMAKYQTSLENMNNASVEYIRGVSVVKAYKQTVYSFQSLHKTIKEYTDMVIPYTLSWENPMSLYTTLINNIYLFVLPIGILIGMNTQDYRAYAVKFLFYLVFVPAIAGVLMKVLYVNSDVKRIYNGVESMDKILAEAELKQPSNPVTTDSFTVEFQNVEFSYDKDEKKALDKVSFFARQGEVTAVVGPSGSGKSTIAHLTPRFFDVDAGKILIGGVDVREFSTSYLMNQVSFVFQDVFLFKQTIYENIAMGNPEATFEQIEKAAKAAQCHSFIEKLPNGYQTVIGTKGVHLSGGEKQRLAIARAIVKDAPIVVLDEATAFADPENEHLIQKAFEVLMKNKTVIIIAHRLSTVKNANNIIVMENGTVVEQGKHEELLLKQGRYATMWKTYNTTSSWMLHDQEA